MRRTALILLLLLPYAAHAARWKEIPSTLQDVIVSIDPASIIVTDYVVKGWIKFDYRVPREHQSKLLVEESSERMVNCQEHTFWVIEGYGQPKGGGDPIRIYSTAEYWTTPSPDSKDEVAYIGLCQESKSLMGKIIDNAVEEMGRPRTDDEINKRLLPF